MKKVDTEFIRNLAIVGHGGDGKTSITEAALFLSGVNTRLGSVDDGTSLMDYEPEEINRKGSILSSIANFTWEKHLIYWTNTPLFDENKKSNETKKNKSEGVYKLKSKEENEFEDNAVANMISGGTSVMIAGLIAGLFGWIATVFVSRPDIGIGASGYALLSTANSLFIIISFTLIIGRICLALPVKNTSSADRSCFNVIFCSIIDIFIYSG